MAEKILEAAMDSVWNNELPWSVGPPVEAETATPVLTLPDFDKPQESYAGKEWS